MGAVSVRVLLVGALPAGAFPVAVFPAGALVVGYSAACIPSETATPRAHARVTFLVGLRLLLAPRVTYLQAAPNNAYQKEHEEQRAHPHRNCAAPALRLWLLALAILKASSEFSVEGPALD